MILITRRLVFAVFRHTEKALHQVKDTLPDPIFNNWSVSFRCCSCLLLYFFCLFVPCQSSLISGKHKIAKVLLLKMVSTSIAFS